MLNQETFRVYAARAGAAMNSAQRRPTLLGRFLAHIIVILILVLSLLVVIPFMLLLIGIGLVVWIYAKVRLAFTRAHNPNGVLDGRRNVRVITRDEN